MKSFLAILLLSFAFLTSDAADVLTLKPGTTHTLGSNDVAEIIAVSSGGSASPSYFVLNGTNNVFTTAITGTGGGIISLLPVVITGPGNVISPSPGGYATVRLRTKAEFLSSLAVPSVAVSSAVVIPEDAAGPVTIVMESSTDLVTWVAANPGNYGATTPRRFFRVRAIQN